MLNSHIALFLLLASSLLPLLYFSPFFLPLLNPVLAEFNITTLHYQPPPICARNL